jgi:hypothetical protein
VKSFNISYQLINSSRAKARFPDDFGLASYHQKQMSQIFLLRVKKKLFLSFLAILRY